MVRGRSDRAGWRRGSQFLTVLAMGVAVASLRGNCQTQQDVTEEAPPASYMIGAVWTDKADKIQGILEGTEKKAEEQRRKIEKVGLQSTIVGTRVGAAIVMVGRPFAHKVARPGGQNIFQEWNTEEMELPVGGTTSVSYHGTATNPDGTAVWLVVMGGVVAVHASSKIAHEPEKGDRGLDLIHWVSDETGGDPFGWLGGKSVLDGTGSLDSRISLTLAMGGNSIMADARAVDAYARGANGPPTLHLDPDDDWQAEALAFAPARLDSKTVTITGDAKIKMEASGYVDGMGVVESLLAVTGIGLCAEPNEEGTQLIVEEVRGEWHPRFAVKNPPMGKSFEIHAAAAAEVLFELAKSVRKQEVQAALHHLETDLPATMKKAAEAMTEGLPTLRGAF